MRVAERGQLAGTQAEQRPVTAKPISDFFLRERLGAVGGFDQVSNEVLRIFHDRRLRCAEGSLPDRPRAPELSLHFDVMEGA